MSNKVANWVAGIITVHCFSRTREWMVRVLFVVRIRQIRLIHTQPFF